MNCIICKTEFDDYNKTKTCDACINYIGECFVCSFCNDIYARTNRKRHMRSFRCISRHGELALYYTTNLNIVNG